MKVLHLITSLRTGGAEVMLQKVVAALGSRGCTFLVVSMTEASRIGAELKQSGTPVVALGGAAGVLLPHQVMLLVRTAREFEPDVIHSWMYHANLFGHAVVSTSKAGARPALISSIRGCLDVHASDKFTLRAARRLDSWLSPRADAIVFNSRRAAEQHAGFGYRMTRAVVIPNSFDTDQFKPSAEDRARLRAELGWDDVVAVGMVARFDPYKDHRNLLEAARIVVARHRRCRFILIGPGCESSNRQLSDWIETFGLIGSVQLLGERHDIAAIQSALDIAVSSSRSESFPNAIGEAMACATPCVVTDVGDCGFLVGDTGMAVPPGDPAALADAVSHLVSLAADQRRELGERARRRVVSEFGMRRIADEYAGLYERCAETGARRASVEQ
jgi:glycosyltransferase involved in cell wall biosynthesis